ncbi:MAG: 50S ribosomal protein L10 [Chloroflexi bacterium]|nr:50S ribosomal protein L10 [Chloroflexota bacterium]
MPAENKVQAVERLAQLLSRSSVVIATNYQGLTMSQITELRQRLRQVGAEYHVVKNTLMSRAGVSTGRPGVDAILVGPTGMAFSSGDPTELAKAIQVYIQTSGVPLGLAGALLDGRVLKGNEVALLATLPSKDVLLAQLLGGLQSPLRGLVYVLGAQLRGLVWVLQSRMKQMEGG